MKIHAATEHVVNGKVVHSDFCPPDCKELGSKEWISKAVASLLTWITEGNGTGYFVIKQEGYPNNVKSKQDPLSLELLASAHKAVYDMVDKRLSGIDRDYLNSKEATRIVNLQQEIEQGINSTITLLSMLEAVEPGEYDHARQEADKNTESLFNKKSDIFLKHLITE